MTRNKLYTHNYSSVYMEFSSKFRSNVVITWFVSPSTSDLFWSARVIADVDEQ